MRKEYINKLDHGWAIIPDSIENQSNLVSGSLQN